MAAAMMKVCDEPKLWHELRSKIPPASPSLDAHLDALLEIYKEARAAPVVEPQFPIVSERRRLAFLMKQRDTATSKLIPPSGGPS